MKYLIAVVVFIFGLFLVNFSLAEDLETPQIIFGESHVSQYTTWDEEIKIKQEHHDAFIKVLEKLLDTQKEKVKNLKDIQNSIRDIVELLERAENGKLKEHIRPRVSPEDYKSLMEGEEGK